MFVAEIDDLVSGKYEVLRVQLEEIKYVVAGKEFISIPTDVALRIRDNLIKGNKVFFNETLMNELNVENITINDFEIVIIDDLEKYKTASFAKVSGIYSYYLAATSGITYFTFTMSSFKLASAGYFITNENREEKYLEIINLGDNELISALEDYLECMDEMQPLSNMYKEFVIYKVALENATTEAEVDAATLVFVGSR